ncbi:MAG: PIN-like domain-containing protein [Chloroflexia bacterium]
MRNQFPGYYRPTKEEFDELWRDCIFTFDANVLLNLYEWTQAQRDQLLDILRRMQNCVWLSNQAALEFHKNRVGKLTKASGAYQTIDKSLKVLTPRLEELREAAARLDAEILQTQGAFIQQVVNQVSQLASVMEKDRGRVIAALVSGDDDILAAVTEIFDGRVGRPYNRERLEQIFADGEGRYKRQVPPGFEDAKHKGGEEKYGDLVLWYQIIDHAKTTKKCIILVTNDQKPDWWWKHEGEKPATRPRPELVQEMLTEAGLRFYMYTPGVFMDWAVRFLNLQTPQAEKIIEEVRERREREEEAEEYAHARAAQAQAVLIPEFMRAAQAQAVLIPEFMRAVQAQAVLIPELMRAAQAQAVLFQEQLPAIQVQLGPFREQLHVVSMQEWQPPFQASPVSPQQEPEGSVSDAETDTPEDHSLEQSEGTEVVTGDDSEEAGPEQNREGSPSE